MAIQWFPGHMNTAVQEIRKAARKVDIVIEVLDARLPASSENPLVDELFGEIPWIRILNKRDLADPSVTAAWITHLQRRPGTIALEHERSQVEEARQLIGMARGLLPADRNRNRTVTAMIVGVPNVGKSTLINTLAGRNIAKTSNKPAVTRMQQRVKVARDFVLLDTPGFLWHKLTPVERGYRLAISGAVGERAVDYPELAMFALRWLMDDYPRALSACYGLDPLGGDPLAVLEAIAERRHCVRKGGTVDYDKVSALLIRDIRRGGLGRLSFERPPPQPASALQEPVAGD